MIGAFTIRPARACEVPAIEALVTPEVLAGHVLPRVVCASDFLVAAAPSGDLIGCVALASLDSGVVELGTLVAARRGLGLGRALVEAAVQEARARGVTSIMALTAIPAFFQRLGFVAAAHRPWMVARRALGLRVPVPLQSSDTETRTARAKSRACLGCPRLERCEQVMLIRSVDVARQARA